jgi:hypothetical protein
VFQRKIFNSRKNRINKISFILRNCNFVCLNAENLTTALSEKCLLSKISLSSCRVVRFKFLIPLTMKNSVFWDVVPCTVKPPFKISLGISGFKRRTYEKFDGGYLTLRLLSWRH